VQLAHGSEAYHVYGLWQHYGGPCGVLAPLQCYLLYHLLEENITPTECKVEDARAALRRAFGTILFGIAPVVYVVFGTEQLQFSSLESYLAADEPFRAFTRQRGIINFVYSCLMTRGIDAFRADGDIPADSKVIGDHNYATQEFVNLLLTGRAVSNVFDGVRSADTLELKGISARSRIGLLTLFEYHNYLEVGSHLKNPTYPIWVIHAESHYSVLFAETLESELKEYIYYDPLGRFDEEKRLSISTNVLTTPYAADDLDRNGMIDKVVRTKFGQLAEIDWNGADRIV